jgi:hypothetical protein
VQVEQSATRAGSGAPEELLDVLLDAERRLVSMPRASAVRGGVTQWAEVVATSQRVMNLAAAVQDEAIASLVAIEPEELDDGTVVQTHRAAGHISLDAPAIVSGALAVSPVHAERRVRAAVRMVADGPSGTDTETGLGGLHDAMRGGRLDAYRAGVVADELELAPPQVAAAVVASLGEHLVEDAAPRLRQRCRTVLSRVSPDLVRERAKRAREGCGLRRWAEEPGVDKWEGTFPSEDAARAWAAIDARAQQLVSEGTCQRIERARSQALIDLVTGSATIETVVTLTVPAMSEVLRSGPERGPVPSGPAGGRSSVLAPARPAPAVEVSDDEDREDLSPASGTSPLPHQRPAESAALSGSPDDLVEVAMGGRGERVLVTRAFIEVVAEGMDSRVVERGCHRDSGALLDPTSTHAYRPTTGLAALVRQRDGRCRFPACQVSARFCDLDHVRPWPAGPTSAANLICLCRRHHRVKQRVGWRVRLHPDARLTWTDPTGRTRTTDPVDALSALVLVAPAAASIPGATTDPMSSLHGTGERCPADECPCARDAADESIAAREAGGPSIAERSAAGPSITDVFSLTEFALEHALAGLTADDHEHRAALHRITLGSGQGDIGPGHRLRVDLHRPQAHRFGADRLVLAEPRDAPPTHRTSRRRASGRDPLTGDPPF